ncbi:DoxX family protein [Flavitalea sp. BT771]|uniref:DoxX family protein n=1 Tax=Flavitalea sp. BT771 TaxID=3063329 RepID=UPI0026E276C9|nr:DoxX family protein [Flavitalea sp. BT771]MDO6432291.1 DoxX family protein [Flavitalea sp. BT771]MDV6221201.1 DoxX family protein [Flavitalea sp. BT771]
MKRFLSTAYSENAFNLASLLLRLTFGLIICINHGFPKLMHFSNQQAIFFDPFHIGHKWSLILVLFAEIFCALLLVLGLFTRFAALVLVIELAVAVFLFHKGQNFEHHEPALLYLTAFASILLVGPGRFSVDGLMGR